MHRGGGLRKLYLSPHLLPAPFNDYLVGCRFSLLFFIIAILLFIAPELEDIRMGFPQPSSFPTRFASRLISNIPNFSSLFLSGNRAEENELEEDDTVLVGGRKTDL